MRLNHQMTGSLAEVDENVANMSSPLMREYRHSIVVDRELNCKHINILVVAEN